MGDHPAGCSAGEAGPPAAKAPKQPRSPTPRDPQAEEISLLILRQKSARAAIRLETFLPPQLKPTRIPDPLDRQEVPASPGWGGGTGRGPAPHSRPQPLFPCSGGGWRPSWRRKSTAAPSRVDCDPYRCTTAPHRLHKGLTFQTPPLVSRAPGAGWGGKSGGKGRSACCLSHIRRHSQQRRQHGSCNKMGKCKLAEVT